MIYQVYPRSFRDSNGDGVGDLAGITAELGQLAELGVDAVWLSPFYSSPQRDAGYDVSDYCQVDPLFGTLADFDRLMEKAPPGPARHHRSGPEPLLRSSMPSSSGPRRGPRQPGAGHVHLP